MTVVFFVHRYFPSVGGVEKYVHELSKALRTQGIAVRVVAGATLDGAAAVDEHEGIPIRRFPALGSPLRARWWFRRHLHWFQAADVVQVSNTHMLEYLWRMVGRRLDRRKVFLTRHGMSYIHPVPEWEKRRARRSLALASGFVHDGAYISRWLGVPADLCPDQGLSPTADELPFLGEPPPTSGVYIGRLERDSGIGIYVDAVGHLVHEHRRPFHLHVYGDGSLGNELRRRVRAERLPVTFHGRVPHAQDRISQSCFALIDGRMAMQEAMARRRLVCAAYVDPLKRDYICGESFGPYLVAAATGAELARAIVHYADHAAERRARVDAAFAFARTLNWSNTAQAYLKLWGQRLAEPRWAGEPSMPCRLIRSLRRETARPKDDWAHDWTPDLEPRGAVSIPAGRC